MPKKSGKTASSKRPARKHKAAAAPAAPAVRTTPRRLKRPQYKSFRLAKRIKHPVVLPNVWRLLKSAALTLWEHKLLFAGITVIYGVLNLLLVQSLAGGTDIGNLKDQLNEVFTGNLGQLASGVSVFVMLLGSAGNGSSDTAGAYQFFLTIIASLAVIWALRQLASGAVARIKDAYYRGMTPLIPFILVLLVIAVQLLPLLFGITVYNIVVQNGIALYTAEKLLWAVLAGLLALLSIYMMVSSLFALYIVTLPDMTPLKALRSARELVRFRRWTVLRKIIILPIVLVLVAAIIMVPIIIWLTAATQWVFFVLTMLSLVVVHTYMYTLYRELLRE